MDEYLERYVNETMDAQVTRNGIFARRSLAARLRALLGMNCSHPLQVTCA